MKNWYKNLTKQQKIFVYLLALAGPWLFAVPANSLVLLFVLYVPLALLIFLQLGSKEQSE
jgi:hypothetical protein